MNKDLKKILIQQGIDTVGRLAGNYLLDSLTERRSEPQGSISSLFEDGKDKDDISDMRMRPGQTEREFREGAKGLQPKYTGDDIPEGLGRRTVFKSVFENPVDNAVLARQIAPFAGMATAGTALDFIFGGKPSSEYKAPMGRANQNVLASNTKARNDESLEALKYKHSVNLMNQKAEIDAYKTDRDSRAKQAAAGNPEFEQYLRIMEVEAADRQGLLGVEKDIARSIFGTGFRA